MTAADVEANQATMDNMRLWRPSILAQNFQSLQRIRNYYEFRDVDVGRYELEDEPRVLMVSGREVTQADQTTTWQNEHLVFTHGFGAVAAKVNTANSRGRADLRRSRTSPCATRRVLRWSSRASTSARAHPATRPS